SLWDFTPELTNVLEHHVAMSVESHNSSQQLFVVADVDQDLSLLTDTLCQDGERSMFEGFLLFSFLQDVSTIRSPKRTYSIFVCLLWLYSTDSWSRSTSASSPIKVRNACI